jgi:hypothetical protein
MKNSFATSFLVVLTASLLFMNCSSPEKKAENAATPATAGANAAENPAASAPASTAVEKKLNVILKTKLENWGGDNKWYDMDKTDGKNYWVNYSDPFKIILQGNYPGVSIKITSSEGEVIFNKSGIDVTESSEFVASNSKTIGVSDVNFKVEVRDQEKVIYTGDIMSVPGGE